MNIFVQIFSIAFSSTLVLIGCFMLQDRLLRWFHEYSFLFDFKLGAFKVFKDRTYDFSDIINILEVINCLVTSKHSQEDQATTRLWALTSP